MAAATLRKVTIRRAWAPYFEEIARPVISKRETRLELATTYLEGRGSTN